MHSMRKLVSFSHLIRKKASRNLIERRQCMCTRDVSVKNIEKSQIELNVNESVSRPQHLQIDWDIEMRHIAEQEERERNRSILAPVEDEAQIYAEPVLRPTFNLAAYVQKSETLQQLIKLGVNLNHLDRQNFGEFIAGLDFKQNVEAHLLLLTKNVGIPIEQMGTFLTKNPAILKENLDDIQTRVNYLELKRFTRDDIVTIVTKNPKWLSFNTCEIDERLGFFQHDFELTGDEVRWLTVKCPKLITYDLMQVKSVSFSMREECGFEGDEVKEILLKVPKIWMKHRFTLMEKYDYIINVMKIENSQLAKMPFILENRFFRIKERHGFLRKIGRAQYNPKLPLYVSLDDLCMGSDEEFALNIAKRPYSEFDRYLRTL